MKRGPPLTAPPLGGGGRESQPLLCAQSPRGPCHKAAGVGCGYGFLESSAGGYAVEEVPGAQAIKSSPEKPLSGTFLRKGGHDAQVCPLRTNVKRAELAQEMPHS